MSETAVANGAEKRRYQRISLAVPAKFLVEDGLETDALLMDISAGGVALETTERPEIGTSLVIYIDKLGRVEGHVVRHLDSGFAVEFEATDTKRERLVARLSWLASRSPDEIEANTPPSVIAPPSEQPKFILDDGREIDCRVLDISTSGVWLEVDMRPPVGEEVTIGRMRGRVSRHHAKGIAIEFKQGAAP